MRDLITRAKAIRDALVDSLADSLDCKPSELGDQWLEFAEAVADVAVVPLAPDQTAIGRLAIAAVQLP